MHIASLFRLLRFASRVSMFLAAARLQAATVGVAAQGTEESPCSDEQFRAFD